MIIGNPKEWIELLQRTLWAHQMGFKQATGISPYHLTYRHEVVLPFEIMA